MGTSAGIDGVQERRERKQLAEPGARELLAAYAVAAPAVRKSILKLLVEINAARAESGAATISTFTTPPKP